MSKLDSEDLLEPSNASNCSNPFDDSIYAWVAGVAAVSGLISLLACCFIIFIIVLFKKWKFFSQRLILYLAITAALLSLAMVLQRVDYANQDSAHYNNFCVFAGFLSQISGWMVLDAVICIQIFLLLTVFTEQQPEKYEQAFLVLIFLFPITFNWIPFIHLTYGRAGAWCWIRSKDDDTCELFRFGQVLQLVLWYIPLYILMFLLIILYAVVLIKLRSMKKKWTGDFDPRTMKKRKQMAREAIPLIIYPLIFFVLNIPPFINRIHGAANPNDPEPALWFISAIMFPLQGGAIALGFSLDPETRKRLNVNNFRAAFGEFCGSKVKEYPVAAECEDENKEKLGSQEGEREMEMESEKLGSSVKQEGEKMGSHTKQELNGKLEGQSGQEG